MEAAGIRQEFEQFTANAGLANFIADECEQYCLLTNSFVQNFKFLSRNNPPEVHFNLCAEPYQMSLAEFCDVCLIPSDGDIREPRPAGYEEFHRTLTVGDERGVSRVMPTSLQFPSMHYFALFIMKCLLAREKVGALCAPDLAVLRHALHGNDPYSLGAIIARQLHINRGKGKIHGGIYAIRLSADFNVQISVHDHSLAKIYFDRDSMLAHHFLAEDDTTCEVPYNIVFSENTHDIIPLPAPALNNPIAREGYRIMPEDIIAYRNPPVEEESQEWDAYMPAPSYPEMGLDGYHGW
jgi:hypothetical protein